MAFQVSGKTALVTGGGSGICLEFSRQLVNSGCNVIIADLALTSAAQDFVSQTQGNAKAVFKKTDVTDWAQLQAAFDAAISEFGSLDIVCPGAGTFEPPWSNFWHFNEGVDTVASNSYKTLEINITHPVRATQLAIDSFKRQKHGHGAVILISSIAAQMAGFPIPLYCLSKAAISSFARSLGPLEQAANIRVNAIAPGCVKTPIWTEDKLPWRDEETEVWVSTERIAEKMLDMIQKEEYVGGTVLEVGVDTERSVQILNDPGTDSSGKGLGATKIMDGVYNAFGLIETKFGQPSGANGDAVKVPEGAHEHREVRGVV